MKIRQQDAQRITFQPCILETGELGAVQTVVLRDVKIGRGWISGRNDNGVRYIDTDCVISREQQYVDLLYGTFTYRKIEND
jgi:hypothetical protein